MQFRADLFGQIKIHKVLYKLPFVGYNIICWLSFERDKAIRRLVRAPLAQLDRVAHYECEGRRFESYMARQNKDAQTVEIIWFERFIFFVMLHAILKILILGRYLVVILVL